MGELIPVEEVRELREALAQAQADAAAMREALSKYAEASCGACCCEFKRPAHSALSSEAGKKLLEQVETLTKERDEARRSLDFARYHHISDAALDAQLDTFEAAVNGKSKATLEACLSDAITNIQQLVEQRDEARGALLGAAQQGREECERLAHSFIKQVQHGEDYLLGWNRAAKEIGLAIHWRSAPTEQARICTNCGCHESDHTGQGRACNKLFDGHGAKHFYSCLASGGFSTEPGGGYKGVCTHIGGHHAFCRLTEQAKPMRFVASNGSADLAGHYPVEQAKPEKVCEQCGGTQSVIGKWMHLRPCPKCSGGGR